MDLREAISLTESSVADGTLPSAVLGVSDARGTRLIHAVRGAPDRRFPLGRCGHAAWAAARSAPESMSSDTASMSR